MVLLVNRHIPVEIVHELLPLDALVASIADLGGEKFHNSSKRGPREEGIDPRLVDRRVRRNGVSNERDQ